MWAHNMALSADGETVFMAPNGVTMTVGDVPSMKALKTITEPDDLPAQFFRRKHNAAQNGIQTGTIAAAGQHANPRFHLPATV